MYDYVIVGGGSAGCVLASRLSEDPSVKVCLLEAGKPDGSFLIHMPAGVAAMLPTKINNWAFQTVPQAGLNGRKGYQPRGKTLGGSSSINAMIYIRGHRADYDRWAEEGAEGWSYREVLPYFLKAENNERGADDYHGTGGPLNVADLRSPNPVARTFLDAAAQVQLPRTDDFNGASQEGVGPYQVTQIEGQRCSAARAYLTPVLDRPNLDVVTGAHATRILFEGRRAVGVAYRQGREAKEARANREVVLSSGAFQSPQLLLLSGVGPAAELKRHGIEVLPGVGRNLQDHIDYVTAYKSSSHDLFGLSPAGAVRLVKAIGEYRREKRGLLTTNFAETGGFLKSRPDLPLPDLQLHFCVGIVDDHNRKFHGGHGYSCHVCLLRPKSRGHVGLAGPDPLAAPLIDPNFLAEAEDLEGMVRGFKVMRQILEAPAFAPIRGRELYTAQVRDDDGIRAAIRARADTVYHPVGTCRMGRADDDMAVVDARLKVRGLDGLRVADASVMPSIIGGNTNAPTIMIGERAAAFIRAAA
jgi:choline dehydrogenase-like flavoprotein